MSKKQIIIAAVSIVIILMGVGLWLFINGRDRGLANTQSAQPSSDAAQELVGDEVDDSVALGADLVVRDDVIPESQRMNIPVNEDGTISEDFDMDEYNALRAQLIASESATSTETKTSSQSTPPKTVGSSDGDKDGLTK